MGTKQKTADIKQEEMIDELESIEIQRQWRILKSIIPEVMGLLEMTDRKCEKLEFLHSNFKFSNEN